MKIGGQRIPGKTLVLILSEGALIGCGLLFATWLRFLNLDSLRQQMREPGALVRYSLVIVVCELALYYFDLYDLGLVRRPTILFAQLLQALGGACLILAVIYFVDPELALGRGVAVIAAPIIITLVISWRLLVDAGLPFLRRCQRVLIMGGGSAGNALAKEIVSRPEFNIEIVGFLHEEEEEDARNRSFGSAEPKSPRECDGRTLQLRNVYTFRAADKPAGVQDGGFPPLKLAAVAGAGVNSTALAPALDELRPQGMNEEMPPVIGTVADVQRLALEKEADLIVLSLSERRGQMPLKELLNLKFLGIQVEEAHNMYERVAGRILLDQLSPSWLILSDGFRKSRPLLAVKRISDTVISVILLVIMAPVAALVALAILLESGRPLLFRQGRVGLNGRTFQIIKFRSMWQQVTPPASQTWTADDDTRITRVGRFIRKFRLDEVPQLINVLLGEMSLVGPRPEQPELARMLEQEIPYYDQRHSLRPGITGWAQVKCGYGATIQQSRIKLEHDLFYIKHLSVMLDSIILFETAKVLLSGRGAK
jgi:lipopolysaccharide/colanic/teichoic acid biosynthesis glycosyltransferase